MYVWSPFQSSEWKVSESVDKIIELEKEVTISGHHAVL